MRELTRQQKIRILLSQGPAISDEISAALKVEPYRIQCDLRDLKQLGDIKPIGKIPAGCHPRTVYELTPLGKARIQRIDKSVNRCQQIHGVLREGPSTIDEVAVTLRIPNRDVKAGIRIMRHEGKVKPIGQILYGEALHNIFALKEHIQ